MAALIMRYDWGDGMQWDAVVIELCPSYGPAELAHSILELSLKESDYIEIVDTRGTLWPLNRETLHMLMVWTERDQ